MLHKAVPAVCWGSRVVPLQWKWDVGASCLHWQESSGRPGLSVHDPSACVKLSARLTKICACISLGGGSLTSRSSFSNSGLSCSVSAAAAAAGAAGGCWLPPPPPTLLPPASGMVTRSPAQHGESRHASRTRLQRTEAQGWAREGAPAKGAWRGVDVAPGHQLRVYKLPREVR